MMASTIGSQPANSRASAAGSPGADHDSFGLLVGRHEPDIVDELAGAHGEDEKMFAGAEPVAHRARRPCDARRRDDPSMGDRSREQRRGWGDHELLQSRMDAVRGDHDVGRGARTIGEREDCLVAVLFEADASVSGLHDVGRQPVDEHGKQVGTVHAVELDPARHLGGPHRRGVGSVRPAELRVDPSGTPAEQFVSEAKPAQHAGAVRLDGHTGADLGQGRRLLVETNLDAALKQGGGGGDTADAAADDRHA